MNNVSFYVDPKEILNKFAQLNTKQQKKVYRSAIRTSLQPLVKQTRANIRGHFGSVARQKDKYGKSLLSGVRMSVYKDGSGGNVSIISNFKLRFFELGTIIRKTKRGFLRGKINAIHFFRNARTTTKAAIIESIDKNIADTIKKIWKSKK